MGSNKIHEVKKMIERKKYEIRVTPMKSKGGNKRR